MMRAWMVVAAFALLAMPAAAQESAQTPKAEAVKTERSKKERTSLFIGTDMGRRMKAELEKQAIEYDPAIVGQAVKDALAGQKPALSDAELDAVRQELQKEFAAKNQERAKALAEKNKKEGEAFLAANKKKEGVKTTASGLQYKVITAGKGRSPGKADTVTVNYRGTLVDGTEFDSSVKRGSPATFSLEQVVSGWSEALMLMQEGAKWQIILPSGLAYGTIGTPGGPIGPNAALIFEIELLSVQDAVIPNMQSSPDMKGK
jgi:FKBP-type peptidyl-prolyl cis-trans isomerase FklB